MRQTLSGWGRYPRIDVALEPIRTEADVLAHIDGSDLIARGNGRGYGDCALNARRTLDMRGFNRMLSFDPQTGQLVGESGLLLSDVIATFLPRGWFPSVTPGTKFVTLGGMIAADVHGKNHHRDGGMGNFVDWIDVVTSDGDVRRCSRTQQADLFDWTLGGMGLTGVILRAAIRLRPVETGWIRQTLIPAQNLDAAMRIFDESHDATYSVAWIDCYATGADRGRSIVMLGEHATLGELSATERADRYALVARKDRRIPIDLPRGLLNKLSVSLFNKAYYWSKRRAPATGLVGWNSYFYPLDTILDWNRIYGSRGFVQFQCVLPDATARPGLQALLDVIADANGGSFLAVLKRMGAAGGGISFPMSGYTLALDFSVTRNALALLDRLDAITVDHGGRFYLAKDARMRSATLAAADPRTQQFRRYRSESRMRDWQSAQSERLDL